LLHFASRGQKKPICKPAFLSFLGPVSVEKLGLGVGKRRAEGGARTGVGKG
jgi:hypothetical protein